MLPHKKRERSAEKRYTSIHAAAQISLRNLRHLDALERALNNAERTPLDAPPRHFSDSGRACLHGPCGHARLSELLALGS